MSRQQRRERAARSREQVQLLSRYYQTASDHDRGVDIVIMWLHALVVTIIRVIQARVPGLWQIFQLTARLCERRPVSRKDWVTTLSPTETGRACIIPPDSPKTRSSTCAR